MKYDFANELFAEVLSARLELIIKVGQKLAFNWLISKEVGSLDAFRIAKYGAGHKLPKKEFSEQEQAEYNAIWERASKEVSTRMPLHENEFPNTKWERADEYLKGLFKFK
jgi:hypothetical protein